MSLRVHSFESMGTVDGPGIRFVVFFQGCHLRCKYCHNRDSWPMQCGREYSPVELSREVMKYRGFFMHGRGGVTASGGEPLLQASELIEFFSLCKKQGVHIALDTSGAVPLSEDVKKLLSLVDLVLLDIKQLDREKHLDLTGRDRVHTELFANYLKEIDKPFWVRYVVVPGYTDSKEDVDMLCSYLQGFPNLQRVELLPYHNLGSHKWESYGDDYPLKGVATPSKDSLVEIETKLKGALSCQIVV